MVAASFISILLAAVVAMALAVFQYYYKEQPKKKSTWGLVALRFCTLFILFLLLFNPEIRETSYYSEKPNLLLLVDNSTSIGLTGAGENIVDFVDEINNDPSIRENFNVSIFSFGAELNSNDSIGFNENQTNISEALNSLDKVYKNSTSPTILITDGNQTYGEDFRITGSRYTNPILPVIVGDTASYRDLAIRQINVNRYAFLGNNFPVELLLNYSGNVPVEAKLEVSTGNSILYSNTFKLDKDHNSQIVELFLSADNIGADNYQARLIPLEGEKNIQNNNKEFVVEVVDERASLLILTEIMHPDLGAIKRSVESNQQREVEIKKVSDAPSDLKDYEVIILYQPTNSFKGIFRKLEQEKRGYWMITGTASDWNLINGGQGFFRKDQFSETEEFFSEFNPDYTEFQLGDIGFSEFPPLTGIFGELKTNALSSILLQNVQGMSTEAPLLGTAEDENRKYAFLFGEGLWKWRSHVYQNNQSHQEFDDFIGGIVQFLAAKQNTERLAVSYEAAYKSHEKKLIRAQYYNRNFEFDHSGKLEVEVIDKNSRESHVYPLTHKNESYEVELGMLEPSEYNFTVSVTGENLSKSGEFKIEENRLEEQFPSANLEGLQTLADNNNQPLFFLKDSKKLISTLLSENTFIPVQKSRKNIVPLVDWYYLLFFIVLTAGLEWFLRKYRGLI